MISSDEHSNIMNDIVNVTSPLTATFSNLRNHILTTYISCDVTVTSYNRVGAGMTTTVNIRTSSPVPTQSNNNSNDNSSSNYYWYVLMCVYTCTYVHT